MTDIVVHMKRKRKGKEEKKSGIHVKEELRKGQLCFPQRPLSVCLALKLLIILQDQEDKRVLLRSFPTKVQSKIFLSFQEGVIIRKAYQILKVSKRK